MSTEKDEVKDSELPERPIKSELSFDMVDAEALAGMQELITTAMPRFPEHLFKRYLLPLSYPDPSDPDPDRHDGVGAVEWRRLVGSLVVNLAILKDGSDEILFVCPGLMPELTTLGDREGRSMRWAELAYDARTSNQVHPGLGETRLYQIGSKALPGITQEEAQAHYNRWAEVWTRYGVNNYVTPTAAPAAETTVPAASTELTEEEDEV